MDFCMPKWHQMFRAALTLWCLRRSIGTMGRASHLVRSQAGRSTCNSGHLERHLLISAVPQQALAACKRTRPCYPSSRPLQTTPR